MASVVAVRPVSVPSTIVTDVTASGAPVVRSVTRPESVNGGAAAGGGVGEGAGTGEGAGDGVGVVGASDPHAASDTQSATRTALLNPITKKAGSTRTRPSCRTSSSNLVHAAHAAAVRHRGRILLLLGNLG